MNCETCTVKRPPDPVPYLVHEGDMARQERTIKRLWITILLLILVVAGSWAGFFWYESQFVDEYVEQEVDTGDGAAYVAGIGDVNYGESQTDGEAPHP